MLWRLRSPPGFVPPCQPSACITPPSGDGWLHEIEHDGYRLMVWRDGRSISRQAPQIGCVGTADMLLCSSRPEGKSCS
jgi:hypothetical protein